LPFVERRFDQDRSLAAAFGSGLVTVDSDTLALL